MTDPVPLSRMRRAIVKSMSVSATVPQFAIEMAVNMSALTSIRARLPEAERPSHTDVLVASVAQALTEHRALNASYTDDGIVLHDQVNVALAVALDDGLISPVIIDADRLAIGRLASERERLLDAARAGSLTPQEVLSATFTISNLGPLGVDRFTALVVPPQAAILAVGALAGETIALTLSVDHRCVDGAPAALFLGQVRSQLQDAVWLQRIVA